MPPISKRTVRTRRQLTATQVYALASGNDFFNEWQADRQAMAEAWDELRDALLVLHISACPGSRPWSWWEFDSPERRQRIDGKPHPFDDGSVPKVYQELTFGKPRYVQTPDHFEAGYECQCSYLARLRLLTGEEKRLMRSPEWACWEEGYDDVRKPHGLTLAEVRAWWEEHQAR